MMASAVDAMDDESSEDEILTFRDDKELQTYMENRLLELGFGQEVSNALHEQLEAVEELRSLYLIDFIDSAYFLSS